MELPAFDMSRARWDAWRAFHIAHKGYTYQGSKGVITQFDTGELVFTHAADHHSHRRNYRELGFSLVSTHDVGIERLKLVMPDGTRVKRSWFPRVNTLLVDHHTKHVVQLNRRTKLAGVPSRFEKDVLAYYPGNHKKPVGGMVELVMPATVDPAVKAKVAALKAACQMWMEMSGLSWTDEDGEDKWCVTTPDTGKSVYRPSKPDKYTQDWLEITMESMSPAARIEMAAQSFTAGHSRADVPYLTVTGEIS